MLEAVVGCATIACWIVGLWFYPRCVDYVTDCCDKQMSPSGVAIDEAQAEYSGVEPETQSSVSDLLSAKYYCVGLGDSPLFSKPEPLPVAKLLKMS